MSIGNTASGLYDCNIWILLTDINHLNVIKAVDSFTLTVLPTLWLQSSQKQNKTLGLPHGSSNLQEKWGFGSLPHRNITFELQISHVQFYYGYLGVLILIFLIALRFWVPKRGLCFLLDNNSMQLSLIGWASNQKKSFIN